MPPTSAKTIWPAIMTVTADQHLHEARRLGTVRTARIRQPTAKKPRNIETTVNAEPDDRLEVPDRRQADVADEVRLLQPVERLAPLPPMSAMPSSSNRSGWCADVAARRSRPSSSARRTCSRAPRVDAGVKPVSGISDAHASPPAIVTAPADHRRPQRLRRRSDELQDRPTNDADVPRRASPEEDAARTRSTPTSSVIHAWYAPLVNVYDTPHSAHSAITTTGERDDSRPGAMPCPCRGSR